MDVDDEVPGKAPALSEAEASRVLADSSSSAEAKERALLSLARHLAAAKNGPGLRGLLARAEPFFAQVPKVRTARIVRALIDEVGSVPGAERVQAELCLEAVDWCVREGRTFLRLRIATQLAAVFLQVGDFKRAIRVVERTVREVKKLDDKALLVEVHLIESRVHHRLRNVPKSKGALTSARSAANAIYCPPKLQASIDQMAGVLSAEERDYKTGYSYFFEAFEGFNQLKQREDAVLALKYMLLMKIMGDAAADVQAIVHGRSGLEYPGREVASMVAVADAHRDRSVHAYRRALEDFKDQLVDDPVVHAHLSQLYENLLEQNLLRIVGPYSRVQISHVARSINLPLPDVEQKLSQMVLDGRLRGVLEQGSGDLIIFEPTEEDTTYTIALDTMKELNGALDRLNAKARGLR